MNVDQFIESWKSKFSEDPPGWIRYMEEPEVELDECQNRIQDLTHSLQKEEFLLSYLRQQVRTQSHQSYFSDDREEYSHTWSDDDGSAGSDSSTEHVSSSVFDSGDTLQDTSDRPVSLGLGVGGGMRQSSLVDLAHAIVENAIHEASRNYSEDFLRKELISTASEPTSPDDGSIDMMDSRSCERAGDKGDQETLAEVATGDGGEGTLAEVAANGGGEGTLTEVAPGDGGEGTLAEVAANGGGEGTLAEVAPGDGGEGTLAELAANGGGEGTLAEVATGGGGEGTLAEVAPGGVGEETQTEVATGGEVASRSPLRRRVNSGSQESPAMASSPISSGRLQRGSETSPDIKDAFQKLDDMLDCVSPLCSPDPLTLSSTPPHPHIVPARFVGHSPPAPGVPHIVTGGTPGAAGSFPIAARSWSMGTGTSPVALRKSSPGSRLPEGQQPTPKAQMRPASQPQGPRIIPVSPLPGESNMERPAGVVLSTRRPSQDGLLDAGSAGRQSGRKTANPIHRVQSGQELDEISLSFDDMGEYDPDTQANLEQAVLSDLSESASAFYSVLASQSLISLDDLDGGQRVLMGSTDDMLNEGDMEMKQYWMQNRPKRRSPSHSSTSGPSGEGGVEERKRPSRVSALYRTTVVEGEALVMRKLVVSGIVSAEKTYLTWLTILKENYRAPLLAVADTSHPLLDEKSIRTIFYGVDELQELHSRLYAQFEERAENWSCDVCVGDLFIELCKCITLYRDYVEMYHKSISHLKKSRQSVSSFQQFLVDVHESVARTILDVPSVEDLLRKPIERLQSYSLVLNDLCQHTPEDHADYRILRESLKAMSDFIASTNDPTSFRELSCTQNKQLVKDQLMVELSEGVRKVRSLLLFNDLLVCAKQKRARDSVKLEHKWHIPLADLTFVPPPDAGTEARKPVTATSDVQLSAMRSRIAELKAQLKAPDRDSASMGSLGRRKGRVATKATKLVKKLNEQLAEYWVAEPSLPLRFFTTSGKNYVFVVHSEDIRESWIAAIKKLQPKAEKMSLSVLDVQELLNKQKLNSTRDISSLQTGDEREYLTGVIRVQVKEARDLKVKPSLYCALEVDEYGRFYRKARTTPAAPIEGDVQWDQGFEIDLDGSQKMRVLICAKQLLKEEVIARGSCVLPVVELRRGRRVKTTITLHPQGTSELVLQYFTSHDAMVHKPALASSGVFGVPLNDVTVNEKHDIPLLVETCVHEVERRGLGEVGIYRVAGVMRDLDELSKAFDTDYLKAQSMAADMDIHAVAGLLKKYFRQLPEPLFTDLLYTSFIQGCSLKDPDARDQCLITLLHSLPLSHFRTAIYILEHIKRVADYSKENKMTLTNLATLFGPNLIRPGKRENRELEATLDIMSQVAVLMYYLSLPSEMYDITEWQRTSPSTLREKLHGATNSSNGSSDREAKTLKDERQET